MVHLGQIQSGLRAAIRIVQGSHIKIHMNSEVPVQVQSVEKKRITGLIFRSFLVVFVLPLLSNMGDFSL